MQHAFSTLPPLTACPAALQERSRRTQKAIQEQPGLIDHPTVQGFGISIAREPCKVSACLPSKASAEMGKWDGSDCKSRYLEGLGSSAVLQMTAAWWAIVEWHCHPKALGPAGSASHTQLGWACLADSPADHGQWTAL